MFSTSQSVKTTFLEPEASELPSSSFQLKQKQNLERIIQASQEPPGVDAALVETSETPRKARPKARRALSPVETTAEFKPNNLLASFKRSSVESPTGSEASMEGDVKRRPDSGITIENLSSIDLLSELAPSEASMGSLPPAYVQNVQDEVSTNRYGVREHTRLLDQAAKNDFSEKLSRALHSTPSTKEEINEQIHQNLLQYKALRQKLYQVLGDYSSAFLKRIRYQLRDLSKYESRINKEIKEKLRTIDGQIDSLFEVFDIHLDSQEFALKITSKWKQVEDIDNQKDLEILFKELKKILSTRNINDEEKYLSKARALLEERLPISSKHQSTSGGFRKLKKACAKLQEERVDICSNTVFGSDDTIQAIYKTVDKMSEALSLIKTKRAHSTKSTSTVYQEDSSSHMELVSPQGSTVKSSDSSAVQAQEDAKPLVDDAKAQTISTKRSASTVRPPRYRSSQVHIRQSKHSTPARRIANWRGGIRTNPIDELYRRLVADVQSFLDDVGNLGYAGKHPINTEKNKKLQRKLTALQKEVRELSDGKQNAKLSKLLEPILTRVGITWRTIKQFLLNDHVVSTKTIVYLHNALSESQARSTRSIASTSTRQPLTREKRRHSAKKDTFIAQREETIDGNEQAIEESKSKEATFQPNEVNHWQHSQVKQTLEDYGLDVRSSTNLEQLADNASQKLSMCTRSYQGEGNDWEDVTTSGKSYAPLIASTIRPSKSGKAISEVPTPKVERRAKQTEEGEWEDVTSSGNSYTPTNAESTVRSVRFDGTATGALVPGNRDYDRHVRTDRRGEHRSRRFVDASYAPELRGSRVTITKQHKFLFFKTSTKRVEMSGEHYKWLCDQDGSRVHSDRRLRRLLASA